MSITREKNLQGLKKLGLAPKVLQNLWVSAELFFNRLSTMCNQRVCHIWDLWVEKRGVGGEKMLF